MRRLKATFINQVDAHEGVGGGANSVDLVRLDTGRTLGSKVSVGLGLGSKVLLAGRVDLVRLDTGRVLAQEYQLSYQEERAVTAGF